jgi:hypothetical protein
MNIMKVMISFTALSIILMNTSCNEDKKVLTIRIGMTLQDVEYLLDKAGAQQVFLSIMPRTTSSGESMHVKCFAIHNKPFIIINYLLENNMYIVKHLSLFYRYQHKFDPRNRWIDVSEIDLQNIDINTSTTLKQCERWTVKLKNVD